MDKFGIFKLLNSFLNFYNQPKGENSQQSDNSNLNLDQLFSNLNLNNAQKEKQNTPLPQTKKPHVPLQNAMLGTLNTHDQFVKRVKEKNGVK